MKAGDLFDGCGISGYDRDAEITMITSDSRSVRPGGLFICLRGTVRDGHDYASDALMRGAAMILAERPIEGIPPGKTVLCRSTRPAESRIWYNFTGRPTDGLIKIAVTGTAGKTTTAYALAHIFRAAGYRVGLITTVKVMSDKRELFMGERGGSSVTDLCGAMTTPDPEYFFSACAEMKTDGCEVLIYEASSQALALSKLDPILNDAAVFTNLSPEHLDSHGDMESYFSAKAGLMERTKLAVINGDDGYMSRLPALYPDVRTVCCSAKPSNAAFSDVCALRFKPLGEKGAEYVYFSERAVFRITTPMIGDFAVMNTMQAAACAVSLGVSLMTVKEALGDCTGADGRMVRIGTPEGCPSVIIDYAHTPVSLRAALKAVRDIAGDRKIVVLFGCGGDRDRTKRPAMAREAQEGADYVIITDDNPRSEDPDLIIREILTGINGSKPYCVIRDRKKAVKYAVKHFGEDRIILLAGKGHEKYEISGGVKRSFDEEEIVKEAVFEKLMPDNDN